MYLNEIKQRPLAALLIHFSPPLSFVGMPDSAQSAVFKIPAHLDPFWASVVVSGLLLLSLQKAPSLAALLRTMRCVHATLIIVEPRSVLHVTRARLRWEERSRSERRGVRCVEAHSRLLSETAFEWNVLTLTVNALHSISSAARQGSAQHSPEISVYGRLKVGWGWAGLLLSP